MLAPTHMVFGQLAFLGASIATGHAPTFLQAIGSAVFSLLPDLDKRQSIVGRMFPFISEPLDYHFGHRTLTHSLLFQCSVGLLLYWFMPFGWWLALVSGLVSHVVGDMMTPQGVAWFWPSTRRCVLPGNKRYRMQPMGWGELWFAVIVGVLSFPLVQLAQAGAGTTGLIRQAIGDIAKAREDYDAGKGSHAWRLEMEGKDNSSYADISGIYPVIGPWVEAGFILETAEGPRSACRASLCDWYAEHAVLTAGQPEQTTTRIIQAEVLTVSAINDALAPLQAAGRVFLLGSFKAKGGREVPPTVTVAGETVKLTYAALDIIAGWSGVTLREVDLLVQVRHAPGIEIPNTDIISE
jgi:inner membrane protein